MFVIRILSTPVFPHRANAWGTKGSANARTTLAYEKLNLNL